MAVRKGYFVFHKEFYDIRKEIGMKAWYELETYMLQLRFEGIDTDPQTIKNKTIKREWILIRKKILDSIDNMNRKNKHNNTTIEEFDIPNCQIPNTGDLSTSNTEDIPTPQQVEEKPTEGLKTGKNEEIPNEFMEEEMLETLMSDEDLIEYIANKFIETEGEDGYNMFIKLNSANPKSDEYRVLSNKWGAKWGRYLTTEKRKSLAEKITDIIWRRYYQRYREVA